MPTALQQYRNLLKEHDANWCWACGRGGEWWDRPKDWYADWWIERSHIVKSPRLIDRRLVVLLCSLCHRAGVHGTRIITAERSAVWPFLGVHHLLWLKRERDPDHYDRSFLQCFSVRRLPRACPPPACYRREYATRRAA